MPATDAVVAGIGDPGRRFPPASTMPATDVGYSFPGAFLQHERLDFALPRPFIRARNQAGTHWILSDVIPLLTIALA